MPISGLFLARLLIPLSSSYSVGFFPEIPLAELLRCKSMPTVPGVSRSVSGVPAFIDPRAGRAELAPQMNGARSKPRYTGILQIPVDRQTMIKTHGKFVGRSTTKNYIFKAGLCLPIVC
jgi:hypothetical protein